ncbi:MAG: hypothetical protein NVS3B26_03660 [Mycobacteriales bacterium]
MLARPSAGAQLAGTLTGLVTCTGVLLSAAPSLADAVQTLSCARLTPAADCSDDPMAPLLALVAVAAWATLVWLLVIAGTALASRLPGVTGRLAAVVCARLAPAALRRLIEVSFGLTVAAGILGGSTSASADPALPPGPPAAAAVPTLDWPSPARSPAQGPTVAPPPVATPQVPAAAVVVRPGDCLWSVTADHLPLGASAAQIARAWPAWWAANRDVVGANPDLIRPGLRLIPPSQP